MDFAAVFAYLSEQFSRRKVRYAVIGGVAVGLRGYPRFTHDLDLLVHRDDFEDAESALIEFGYESHAKTRTFSRFVGPLKAQGIVDLQRATPVLGPMLIKRSSRLANRLTGRPVPVVQPEDLIGLKIIAIANDPRRRTQDEADIVAVARANQKRLSWKRIREYYAIVKRPGGADRLRRDVGGER